jgi:hypothetical protein
VCCPIVLHIIGWITGYLTWPQMLCCSPKKKYKNNRLVLNYIEWNVHVKVIVYSLVFKYWFVWSVTTNTLLITYHLKKHVSWNQWFILNPQLKILLTQILHILFECLVLNYIEWNVHVKVIVYSLVFKYWFVWSQI